jgi:hypothetical protein
LKAATVHGDDETGSITFDIAWEGFVEDTNVVEGSMLLTKVDAIHDATIILNSIMILNP